MQFSIIRTITKLPGGEGPHKPDRLLKDQSSSVVSALYLETVTSALVDEKPAGHAEGLQLLDHLHRRCVGHDLVPAAVNGHHRHHPLRKPADRRIFPVGPLIAGRDGPEGAGGPETGEEGFILG